MKVLDFVENVRFYQDGMIYCSYYPVTKKTIHVTKAGSRDKTLCGRSTKKAVGLITNRATCKRCNAKLARMGSEA